MLKCRRVVPLVRNTIERRIVECAHVKVERFSNRCGPVPVVFVLTKLEIDRWSAGISQARLFVILADVIATRANQANFGVLVIQYMIFRPPQSSSQFFADKELRARIEGGRASDHIRITRAQVKAEKSTHAEA